MNATVAYTRAVGAQNTEACASCAGPLPVGLRIVRAAGRPHHLGCAPPEALRTGSLDLAQFVH